MAAIDHVLIDSNVLIDVITGDPAHFEWSADQLVQVVESGRAAINPLIFAEVSVGFTTIEQTEAALPRSIYRRLALPWRAAFLAGQAFATYRRRGGSRTAPLLDFYIGAHAAVAEIPLLTRDSSRFRTYFPELRIIAPE
ncbi:MAG: hypothetical protein AMXMBFR64_15040 [Myxococcales bacterium]